ncbi:Cerebellar degeneration-related protein 2-like [Caenorhabditis elegans]|uniref:Cerebellar degeneration-related protein 2-like n=1 Tax=Caenorhabditis elegans TaxID=6239 RepID=C6KRG7_CAEEL|nr:Cerebellar degeneration-related protein 2-like [Caenorhabditis elegans]CCD69454.2 Cerebellar degeneration-related protein 2-like [Caenorhabditis elegans]|eukprot:NP_001256973.1 Uncharacterized protein CELE_F57C12.6 [Caenorhabditis elegans]
MKLEKQQLESQVPANNPPDTSNAVLGQDGGVGLSLSEINTMLENVRVRLTEEVNEHIVAISNLSHENEQLRHENSTLKMLYDENIIEVDTLAMISAALSLTDHNTNQQPTEEIALESELQDTDCVICHEEMRLKNAIHVAEGFIKVVSTDGLAKSSHAQHVAPQCIPKSRTFSTYCLKKKC